MFKWTLNSKLILFCTVSAFVALYSLSNFKSNESNSTTSSLRKIKSQRTLIKGQQIKTGAYKRNPSSTSEIKKTESKTIKKRSEQSSESKANETDESISSLDSSRGVIGQTSFDRNDKSLSQDSPEKISKKNKEESLISMNGGFAPIVSGGAKPGDQGSQNASGNETTSKAKGNSTRPMIVKGKVLPLAGLISYRKSSFGFNQAYAATTCIDPKILLFDLETMDILARNPINAEELNSEVTFVFDPVELNLDLNKPTRYMLKTHGCDVSYERIITNFYDIQNLTTSSTLIAKVIKSSIPLSISEFDSDKLHTITAGLELNNSAGQGFSDVFDNLSLSSDFTTLFTNTFGSAPDVLEHSAPDITEYEVPDSFSEKTIGNLSVSSKHWDLNYDAAYEWYIDNTLLSTNSVTSYTPVANSLEEVEVKLILGFKNTGDNLVNRSYPYHEIVINVPVIDTYPVTAPTFALDVSTNNPSNTSNINLNVSTGAAVGTTFEQCETFSSFAIMENNVTPEASDYTFTCSSGPNLILPYSLLDNSDGLKTLKLWSRDARGNISTPESLTVILDQTPAGISFVGLNTDYRADMAHTFSWQVNELSSSSSLNYTVDFFNGSSWISQTPVPSLDGELTSTLFSTSITLGNIQTSNAKIRVGFTDLAGNSVVTESSIFSIQKPAISISPTAHNFGIVPNQTSSTNFTFTIDNTGLVAANNCSPAIVSGTNSTEFSILSDNCSTNNLGAGSSCTIDVSGDPTSKGTKTASLSWSCGSDSVVAALSYTSTNNAPVAPAAQNFSTDEDVPLAFTLLGASDLDSDTIVYDVVTPPSHGTLTNCLNNNGDLTCDYLPNLNYNGSDTFAYRSYDGTDYSATNTLVTLTVNPVNDAPTLASSQTITIAEDNSITFDLTAGSDVDGDTLSYIKLTDPAAGTLSCVGGTSRSCTYTPAPDDNGTYTFNYKVNDGTLDSNVATVTINISAVNDAPVMIGDQSFTTNEDTLLSLTLNGATDIDLPAQTLSYKIITPPSHGTLSGCINTASYGTNLTCDYQPNLNYNGSDSFTYIANDSIADSNSVSTVTLTISPVNDAPTLTSSQSISVNEDNSITFDLTAGNDVDGDTLSYYKLTDTTNGTISCVGGTSRSCTYVPNANFHGTDTFTYKVNDSILDSNIATVTITVNSINDIPLLSSPQNISTDEDTAITFDLTAGTDVDGDTLSYIKVSDTSNGLISCVEGTSRACTYTPNADYNGSDSFTYKVNDGLADSTIATVNITVNPINDPPTLNTPSSIATDEDTPISFALNYVPDIDGDVLSYIIVSSTTNGNLSCVGGTTRDCTYTPNPDFNGSDSFTYKTNDGTADSNIATYNITINPVNDPPVMGAAQSLAAIDNTSLNFSLNPATDIDLPAQTITYKVITPPSHGTLSNCISTGSYSTDITCTYTANVNFNGVDSFTYIANDGIVDAIGPQTVTFNVTDQTPPSAPAISLASNLYTNSLDAYFTASSCLDTPFILINEGSQPGSGDVGWQACNTTASGLTYSISAGEGLKNVKVWSKDAQENVSTASTQINIIYDITAPSLAFTGISSVYKGGDTYPISFTVTELNISSAQSYLLKLYDGSTETTITNTNVTAGPHGGTTFTFNWSVPTIDSSATLRLWLTDNAGNQGYVESGSFNIDSTAPIIFISSPGELTYHQSSLTLTGVCEAGAQINISGDIPAAFDITCVGGTFSQLVNLSSGDGNKTITLNHTDAAGNVSTTSRTFIRDEVAPVLARTSGENPGFTNNNNFTWSGTCEGNYTINITGDETSTTACNNGVWSWTTGAQTVDGVFSYNLTQTDAAGNTSSALGLSWERDGTPPNFTATAPVAIASGGSGTHLDNLDSVSFSGNCDGTNVITISGEAAATITCSASSWSWTSPVVSTDGVRAYHFSQADSAGNTATLSLTWTRDTTGPALNIAKSLIKTNTNSVQFTGQCEDGLTINIAGAETATTTCNTGLWSFTTAAQTTDGDRIYTFSQTNATSNTTSVDGRWLRGTNLPTVSALSTTAPNPTTNASVPITMSASSNNTNILLSEICVKTDITTTPLDADECWVGINSPSIGLARDQNLNLTGQYFHILGWTPSTNYTVYAWVKDEATNISNLTSGGTGTAAVDFFNRIYDPGIPPEIFDVVAANTPNVGLPPTQAQANVPAGSDLYIRWKTTDNLPLPANSISISYTEDEKSFTQIGGATALAPYVNHGCDGYSLQANEGCFKWTGGSPLNNFYKIQVTVTDSTAIARKSISNPINSGEIKIIAGNTELGLGGSASASLFKNINYSGQPEPGLLVVSNDGRFYFNDHARGIVTVDPTDGKQKLFLPKTGTSSGDGGPAINATSDAILQIALDYQNRLLVREAYRIRRIDLNQATPTIETIIGGGVDTNDTVANPKALSIGYFGLGGYENLHPFFALPNGDIYFSTERGYKDPGVDGGQKLRVRIYKAATQSVISKYPMGLGDGRDPVANIQDCRLFDPTFGFDPNTSNLTHLSLTIYRHESFTNCTPPYQTYSRVNLDPETFQTSPSQTHDGHYYAYYRSKVGMNGATYKLIGANYAVKLNEDGTWTRILGSGSVGNCTDGTPAASCNMRLYDLFVKANGDIYFIDDGRIRTIDSSGNVVTLFGQTLGYGNGVNALNARFSNIRHVARLNDGRITTLDGGSQLIKEFTVAGNINLVAGNGNQITPNTTDPALNQGLADISWSVLDKFTGDIYSRQPHYGVSRLNRGTGKWETILGGGAVDYTAADGQIGTDVANSWRVPLAFDSTNKKLLVFNMTYNSPDVHWQDFMIKSHDGNDFFRQSHIAGTDDPTETFNGGYWSYCALPSPAASCKISYYYSWHNNVQWDSVNNRWILIQSGAYDGKVIAITPGGNIEQIGHLGHNVDNSAYYLVEGTNEYIYSCYAGRIRKYDLTNGIDLGALNWPISNLSCSAEAYNMDYNPTNNSLIFAFQQNGLQGVAEYFLP